MTLHYRKLLIASLVLPLLVLGVFALMLPSLMQARTSAVFAQMRSNAKETEQLVEVVAATNSDAALEPAIEELRETVQRQYDSLVDLRDVMLNEAERKQSGGWIPLITGAVAMIGTLSSVLLSWRQDMRQSQADRARLQPDISQQPTRNAA